MVCCSVAVALTTFLLLTQLPSGTGSSGRPILSCLLQAWSVYRPSYGRFDVVDVDPSLCTHVVYAFVGLDNLTNTIISRDAFAVENGVFKNLVGLKQFNPSLVVTVALGGWSEGSVKYSNMAASRETRKIFIESVVQYLGLHSLDGLNLDWQDPAARGGSSFDKQNYVLLCRELSEEFRPRGWHLAVGVSAQQNIVDNGYDLPELVKHVDLVYVRTTDYHGSWDGFTGHVAPLFPRDDEDGYQRRLNVNSTLSFILSDVPPEKLVLTVPLYGRTFLLEKASENGYGAPVLPAGFPGPYTEEDGLLGYNEICELLSSEAGQWTVHRSTVDASPYAVSGDKWVSYDDRLSISKKVEVVRSSNLAGVSVLGVDNDDFKGRCGEGPYPLLTHIKNQLVEGHVTSPEVNLVLTTAKQSLLPSPEPAPKQRLPVKACFLASESVNRESLGKFTIEDIDPSLCTHVVFCYSILNQVTGGIDDKDPVYIADGAFKQLVALKARNPDLLVHVAIGGWEDGALKYAVMASTPESRATFVESVVAYLRLHKLDGLNLDWQDPATRGGIELDKQNYVLLCQELRAGFQPHGWQLTVSVSAHKHVLDAGYDLPALASHVDLLYVGSFAYHGPWEGHTGIVAPLYARDDEEGDQRFLNVNFTLSYILSQGVPAHKVVPAVPFTFRTYILLNRRNDAVGAPSRTEGFSGPYTKAYSSVAYFEICTNIHQPSSWKVRYDPQQRVPFMVQGEKWIGYEDNDSIREKMTLASRLGVGGVMAWTVDADDFRGSCGLGRYPLLNAISREMAAWSGTPGGNASAGGEDVVAPSPTDGTSKPINVVPTTTDGPFLPHEGTSSGPDEGCIMAPLMDVSVDVLTCGNEDTSCAVENRVPALTVVYAVCWDTVSMVLRCHRDGYWRPYSEASPGRTDAGDGQVNEGGRMRLICHPHYVNSPVCGQRPRYKSTRGFLDLGVFFEPVNQHSWVVGVMRDRSHTCTATLISPLHVLTAAHCVASGQTGTADAQSLQVQIGTSALSKVVDIKVNPDYHQVLDSRYSNDVAILRLEKPLQFSSKLNPACVNVETRLVSTKQAYVFQYVGESSLSGYRVAVEQFDSSCQRPQYPCYFQVETERTVFCGAPLAPNEALHYGSPGSPFLQNFGDTDTDERWTVSGVVSRVEASKDCAQNVTVLSAVDAYRDWITTVVNEYI